MSRPVRITLILVGLVAFVAISLGVGRMLGARDAERVLVERIIRDEAGGNAGALARELPDCGPGTACNRNTVQLVKKVAGPGQKLEILQVTKGAGLGPTSAKGVSRIAWHVGGRLPVVQCLVLEKTGDVVNGFGVRLLKISNPIAREGACPGVVNLLV